MSQKVRQIKDRKSSQIELTLATLLGSQKAVTWLVSQRLPIQTAFKLARLTKAINAELQTFDETRRALCERFGTLRDDKSKYDIPPAKQDEFDKEFATLTAMQIELPGTPLRAAELGRVEMSADDLMALEWLIVE